MKRVCAWCKKGFGEIEPLDDDSITHTICPECAVKLEGEDEKETDDDAL
jgi:hypothetical protein